MIVTKFPFGARLEQHWPGEVIFKWGHWLKSIDVPRRDCGPMRCARDERKRFLPIGREGEYVSSDDDRPMRWPEAFYACFALMTATWPVWALMLLLIMAILHGPVE